MEMEAEAKANKRSRTTEADESLRSAKQLLDKIIGSTEGNDFADPRGFHSIPFPFMGIAPHRFDAQRISGIRHFKYMGRTRYADLRNTVVGLRNQYGPLRFVNLPVRAANQPRYEEQEAALWGTMGSGKSFMLAVLACDLLASFYRSRDSGGKAFQRQRVVYLPDCEQLLHSSEIYFHQALSLSYADDVETLARINMLSDDASVTNFFKEEAAKGVCIYLLVDQFNALDVDEDEKEHNLAEKKRVSSFIRGLASYHLLVQSASANNINAKKWYAKQQNIAAMFHHGGLDDDEFKNWKKHFATSGGSPTSLVELTEEQELRVKDATGCVPLFLHCWNDAGVIPENAWQQFITLRETANARMHLQYRIKSQLSDEPHHQLFLDMYFQFMTEGQVDALPDMYDCRYLFVAEPNRIGRCLCGVFRDCIGEILQSFRRSRIAQHQWKEAIKCEAEKHNPNLALMGFMVEHEMISAILEFGIPLYVNEGTVKCDSLVYFKSGREKHLEIKEGCTLYVPSAYNYPRVDAVIRQYDRSGKLHDGSFTPPDQLINMYSKLRLHIAGVQISLGSLEKHLSSEHTFCSPDVMTLWHPDWDSKDVARWFIWYVLQSEMDNHSQGDVELSPCRYGILEVKGKTRTASVQGLDHVTIFRPLEDFEPCLKWMKTKI